MSNERAREARVTLAECPIGLFRCGDTLALKTEYGSNEGRIDAYIVETGEFFWGNQPQTIASQRAQLVEPIETDFALEALSRPPVSDRDEEVERVARAIFEAYHYCDPLDEDPGQPNFGRATVEQPNGFKTTRVVWEACARAALASLPTGREERLKEALEGLIRNARPTNWDDDEDLDQWKAWLAADAALALKDHAK